MLGCSSSLAQEGVRPYLYYSGLVLSCLRTGVHVRVARVMMKLLCHGRDASCPCRGLSADLALTPGVGIRLVPSLQSTLPATYRVVEPLLPCADSLPSYSAESLPPFRLGCLCPEALVFCCPFDVRTGVACCHAPAVRTVCSLISAAAIMPSPGRRLTPACLIF